MDKKNTIIGVLLLCAAFYFMFDSPPVGGAGSAHREGNPAPQLADGRLNAPAPKEEQTFRVPGEKNAKERIVSLKNDDIAVNFTNLGGAVADVELLKYEKSQGSSQHFAFNAVKGAFPALTFAFFDPSCGFPAPVEDEFFLVESSDVSLRYELVVPGKYKIERFYSLADTSQKIECAPYLLKTRTSVKNISRGDLPLGEVFLCLGAVPPTESDVYGSNLASVFFDADRKAHYARSSAFINSSGFLGIGASRAKSHEKISAYPVTWASVKNQFFASVFTPEGTYSTGGIVYPIPMDTSSGNKYMRNAVSAFMGFEFKNLKPGESAVVDGSYYVGPKELDKLYSMGGGQEEVMNYGWFGFVSRPLSRLMKWIHSWVSAVSPEWGWGWSIIILTLLVRGLMWPLTSVQIKSAQRMAKMQEPLKAIREKYKGDNKKIQQETMKIYSEYGINPLAGCLPILVQIPIFIGLYYMLQTSCEIRFAHFLWVDDLSLPDTIGALPSVFGIPLHILPILNALVTFLQMHLTPTPSTDKTQAMMFKFMPLIMLLFFYTFPSGLVLYWLVQSILGILQAVIIRRGKNKTVLKKRDKPGFMQRMQEAMENAQKMQNMRGEDFKKLPLREQLRIVREDAAKARKNRRNDPLRGTVYEKRKKNPGGRSTPPKR